MRNRTRWLLLLAMASVTLSSACATLTAEPVAFTVGTRHDPNGTYAPSGSAEGKSCETKIDLLFGGGASALSFRTDHGKPRAIHTAIADAMTKCRGCAWIADVAVETQRDSSFFGMFSEVCTTVSGIAMVPSRS